MNIDRERFGSGALPIWVHYEHKARWLYGCTYVPDKIVVDCACGVGEGSYMFANAGARHVYAFDLSDDAVSITQKRCANLPNVIVQQASGLSLPLEDGSVDVFVSFETIEHIDNDQGFLNEVARLLAPNGVFLCSTPNRTITMPGKTLKVLLCSCKTRISRTLQRGRSDNSPRYYNTLLQRGRRATGNEPAASRSFNPPPAIRFGKRR